MIIETWRREGGGGRVPSAGTHSDPDESPSTVPALMVRATPFSCSGRPALARPSLEEDPRGEPGASPRAWPWPWTRLGQALSTMGDSCFFFRIPAVKQEAESE